MRRSSKARVWKPAPIEPVVLRDPDDDQVIAAAVAANSDLIVSGDRDLLDLGHYSDLAIVTAAEAVDRCGLKG